MTDAQKRDFLLFLQKFCSDNVGNKLNEWIIEAFLNRTKMKLDAMEKAGAIIPVDAQKIKDGDWPS